VLKKIIIEVNKKAWMVLEQQCKLGWCYSNNTIVLPWNI